MMARHHAPKRRGSPYRSDRVKAVCTVRDSFAVIGAAGSPARVLRLARLVEGELVIPPPRN
jgi:hypothetical protein